MRHAEVHIGLSKRKVCGVVIIGLNKWRENRESRDSMRISAVAWVFKQLGGMV